MERKIRSLQKEKNAVILAHYYQVPEVQAIADYIGDSLELSRIARDSDADTIVFCGVRFMAETAKILSPSKKVLIPEIIAGCPLAESVTPKQLAEAKAKHPDYAVVSYVNTNADVKAMSDVCCTSANAVSVVKNIDNDKIIFVPDGNLGRYAAKNVPDKTIIPWHGSCYVHEIRANLHRVIQEREKYPDALVLAHPECNEAVLDEADFIGSTSQIIKFAAESESTEFIIVTERGIEYMLNKRVPDKTFHFIKEMVCFNMKKISLESVYYSLKDDKYEITLPDDIISRSAKALNKMLDYS